jgi:2-polyprenyl-3-methyl-5-hydroxy-6-metoxy-1,4-benzoquinol methylase
MKVSEIRPDGLMAGQEAAMQKDLDWLAARKERFVEVSCPVCGSSVRRPLYEKYGMQHQLCDVCGTQYVSPRPTAEMLGAFYAGSENYRYWAKEIFPASREKRRAAIFQPRAAIVADLVRRHGLAGGVLVEVGAAHGLFCDEIRKLNLFARLVAIEPTPDMASECRALGFETIEAPWERVRLDQPAQVIAAFEVIEHLFDPGAFLRWCHANLLADGHVLFTCPNIVGFETLLLGKASGAVDHEHINLFTPQSLCRLIEASGFTVIESTTPGELDVELVRRALDAGDVDEAMLGPVVSRLLRHADPDVWKGLQDLLKRAGLSSNMLVLARVKGV